MREFAQYRCAQLYSTSTPPKKNKTSHGFVEKQLRGFVDHGESSILRILLVLLQKQAVETLSKCATERWGFEHDWARPHLKGHITFCWVGSVWRGSILCRESLLNHSKLRIFMQQTLCCLSALFSDEKLGFLGPFLDGYIVPTPHHIQTPWRAFIWPSFCTFFGWWEKGIHDGWGIVGFKNMCLHLTWKYTIILTYWARPRWVVELNIWVITGRKNAHQQT